MNTTAISRILISGTFLAAMTVGINAMAQAAAPQAPENSQQAAYQQALQRASESNPSCQKIVKECKKLGFVQGDWKTDNGLWKDCVDPVVQGGKPTREGKPIDVPVSASEVQACRAAVKQVQKKSQGGAEQHK